MFVQVWAYHEVDTIESEAAVTKPVDTTMQLNEWRQNFVEPATSQFSKKNLGELKSACESWAPDKVCGLL